MALTEKQIQLWLESTDDYGMGDGRYWVPTKESFEELCNLAIKALRPEAGNTRDAERYRWLRNEPTGDDLNDIIDAYWQSPEAFDAAVDKAAGMPTPQKVEGST